MAQLGTASRVDGGYVAFQAAVLRALPRDINPDVALNWTQNSKLLKRVFREVLTSNSKPIGLPDEISVQTGNAYLLLVDYGRSTEDGIQAGQYDWPSSGIISRNFPARRRGVAWVVVELVHFSLCISVDEVIRELDTMGYRPADLNELLALGEKFPEAQRSLSILALGSVGQDGCEELSVACLCGNSSNRFLTSAWIGGKSLEDWWFAAIRESHLLKKSPTVRDYQ